MLLTVDYLLAKLSTFRVCFCVFFCFALSFLRAVISAIWHFFPMEHLFLHVDFICITSCDRLCSQVNDYDDRYAGVNPNAPDKPVVPRTERPAPPTTTTTTMKPAVPDTTPRRYWVTEEYPGPPSPCTTNFDAISIIRGEVFAFKDKASFANICEIFCPCILLVKV